VSNKQSDRREREREERGEITLFRRAGSAPRTKRIEIIPGLLVEAEHARWSGVEPIYRGHTKHKDERHEVWSRSKARMVTHFVLCIYISSRSNQPRDDLD
jgi:hypothetical protein